MLYMNDYDIMHAQQRIASHPVLAKAVQFLALSKNKSIPTATVGPIGSARCKAANKLMRMLQGKIRSHRSELQSGHDAHQVFHDPPGLQKRVADARSFLDTSIDFRAGTWYS